MDGFTLSTQVNEIRVVEVTGATVVVELVELTWSHDPQVKGQVVFIAGPAVASSHAALM